MSDTPDRPPADFSEKEPAAEHNPPTPAEWMSAFYHFLLHWYDSPHEKSKPADWWLVGLTVVVAIAAFTSAIIFRRQLKEADDTTKRQFRAYLLYERGDITVSKDGRSYVVSIEVKNFGQTPAYSTTHWFTAERMNRISRPFEHFLPPEMNPPNEPVKFGIVQKEGASDLGNGQSICIQKKIPAADFSGDDGVIYVRGDVKYRDQFARCQFAAFVLESVDQVVPGRKLRLAKVFNWTSDPASEECTEYPGYGAKLPWEEEPPKPDEPKSVVFQGACPPN